jgi:hypothetical protein
VILAMLLLNAGRVVRVRAGGGGCWRLEQADTDTRQVGSAAASSGPVDVMVIGVLAEDQPQVPLATSLPAALSPC